MPFNTIESPDSNLHSHGLTMQSYGMLNSQQVVGTSVDSSAASTSSSNSSNSVSPTLHNRCHARAEEDKMFALGEKDTLPASALSGTSVPVTSEFVNSAVAAADSRQPLLHAAAAPTTDADTLAADYAKLQAEYASAKDELQALKHRLKQIEEHNISIPPTVLLSSSLSTHTPLTRPSPSMDLMSSTTVGQIHIEQQALAAWQHSQALDIPLPLMQHVQQFDAEPFLRLNPSVNTNSPLGASTVVASQRLQKDLSDLIDYSKPNRRSEARRANVLAFLKLLVRKSLGAQVYPIGAYALKTYVGQDEVMDVSAFFSRAHDNTWLHRITNALCQEASSNHHNSNSVHATNTNSPHYTVSHLSVSFSKLEPYIHTCIGGIHVNLFGNNVAGLSSLALFERIDLLVGQNHLFKRTILLVKCWFIRMKVLNYSAPSSSTSATGESTGFSSHLANEGLLSGMFMRTLVFYIFNVYGHSITTPLEGLYRLLEFLKDFDWEENAITAYGAVTLSSLEQHGCSASGQEKWEYVTKGPSAWPQGVQPFVPRDVWKQYSFTNKDPARSSSRAGSAVPATSSRIGSASGSSVASSSLNSPMLQSTSARSNSDNSLVTLPARTGGVVTSATGVAVHAGRSSLSARATHSSSNPHIRPHSQSFSAIDLDAQSPSHIASVHAAVNATNVSLRSSAHSQSYSNLSNLQQFSPPILQQHQSRFTERELSTGAAMGSESLQPSFHDVSGNYSPSDSNGATPSGSASLTPAASHLDLQKLVIGMNNSTTTPPTSAAAIGSGKLGFNSGGLRPSASSKQLSRMPDPIALSSSSFFSSHTDDVVSDSESPDPEEDDVALPTSHSMRHIGSSNSIDEMEGSEYLDISGSHASPLDDDHNLLSYPMDQLTPGGSPVPSHPVGDASLFTKCALNVLDPIDPQHNLGTNISYKHEFHIRRVFHDSFLTLKNAIQKYSFQQASKQESGNEFEDNQTSASDKAVADLEMHPVVAELFDDALLAKYKEHLSREFKALRFNLAASPSVPVGPSSLAQVFQNSTPTFINTELGNSADKPATISPPRSLNQSAFLSTAPLIVDDVAVASRLIHSTSSTLTTSTSSAASGADSISSTVSSAPAPTATYDILSGDFDKIVANLDHARQFETPDLSEDQLVHLIIDVLKERVSVPVGRMGSLLHDVTLNHSLPAMLKENFGGLKRLLERHTEIFHVSKSHPYNPDCSLKPKWYLYAPPRPNMSNLTPNANNNGQNGHGGNGVGMSSNGSSGNLSNLANLNGNGAVDGSSRRKLQRRRTRTRRTNSGASAVTVAAVPSTTGQVTRNGLMMEQPQQIQQSSHHAGSIGIAPHPRTANTIIGLDCEMVGIGPSGYSSMLARVSIVNMNGETLYDKYVLPSEPVTDYRTAVSGILPQHLESGTEFRQVQREVSQIVKNRIMVGHGLTADLQALCIAIPKQHLRDTAAFKLFCPVRPLPLKQLVKDQLGHLPEFHSFQQAQHNSVADARAALSLYKLVQQQWESMVQAENMTLNNNTLGHATHSHSQPDIHNLAHQLNAREISSQQQQLHFQPNVQQNHGYQQHSNHHSHHQSQANQPAQQHSFNSAMIAHQQSHSHAPQQMVHSNHMNQSRQFSSGISPHASPNFSSFNSSQSNNSLLLPMQMQSQQQNNSSMSPQQQQQQQQQLRRSPQQSQQQQSSHSHQSFNSQSSLHSQSSHNGNNMSSHYTSVNSHIIHSMNANNSNNKSYGMDFSNNNSFARSNASDAY